MAERSTLRGWAQAPPASADDADQATASAELGLAVLASFCRVPALAESQDAIEKAPLLLRVSALGLWVQGGTHDALHMLVLPLPLAGMHDVTWVSPDPVDKHAHEALVALWCSRWVPSLAESRWHTCTPMERHAYGVQRTAH